MDDREYDYENDYSELAEDARQNQESAILYRVDERTLQIVNRLERLQEWSEKQDTRLSEIEDKVNFHQSVIRGILFVLSVTVTAFVGLLFGLIPV